MRRIPAPVWILAPFALSLLYVLAYGRFAPSPSLMDVVPEEAILVHRFKDRTELDRGWLPALERTWRSTPQETGTRPSERMARDRNVAGLPGVDSSRPFHLVFLPRRQRPNPTMMILPVENADVLEARFEDPSFFLERGYVRRAQYLAVRGNFAAVGGDPDAVQQLGTGGITAEPLGEDHAIAVKVPELARFALAAPWDAPWRDVLEALGVRPEADAAGHPMEGIELPVGRLLRIAESWREARMWSWRKERRVRLVLQPSPGPLSDLLDHAVTTDAPASSLPPAPIGSLAWVHVPDAAARAVIARGLWDAGALLPEPAGGESPLGELTRPDADGGLLLFATASPGTGHAWTLGVLAERGEMPDWPSLFPVIPAKPGAVEAAEGELPITLSDLRRDRRAPAGRIVRSDDAKFEILLLGAAVPEAGRRLKLALATGESDGIAGLRRYVEPVAEGDRLLAAFFLTKSRARTLFGPALEGGGLLGSLADGNLAGSVWTDGRRIRVEVQVMAEEGAR